MFFKKQLKLYFQGTCQCRLGKIRSLCNYQVVFAQKISKEFNYPEWIVIRKTAGCCYHALPSVKLRSDEAFSHPGHWNESGSSIARPPQERARAEAVTGWYRSAGVAPSPAPHSDTSLPPAKLQTFLLLPGHLTPARGMQFAEEGLLFFSSPSDKFSSEFNK